MKQLQPIIEKSKYYKLIEKHIKKFFDELIYDNLFEIINKSIGKYYNSSSYLREAILKGQIQYVNGRFYGKFNAKISKELKDLGAKWNKDSFSLPNLPDDLLGLVGQAQSMFEVLHEAILTTLANVDTDKLLKTFSFDTAYIETLTDLDEQAYNTLKKDIGVVPEFTEEMKQTIADNYTNNLKLYIKNFTDNEIVKLRKLVEENMFDKGARAENLVNIIQDRFNVSQNKAKFLARQESSLLVSEYRVEKYREVGIKKLKWSTSHDKRVRPLHRQLDGLIFDINDPPIIDDKGNKGFGGQAFGCRCVSIALIE